MSEKIISQFVKAMGKMSSRDLYQLAAVLRDPEQRDAAIGVILGMAGLKSNNTIGNSSKAVGATRATDPKTGSTLRGLGTQDTEAMRSKFFALLSDKVAFPNTKDVITALNDSFGFKLKYFGNKESRGSFLIRAWEKLETLPNNELSEKLRSFCSSHRRFEEVDSYKELFKILSRGE